MSPNAWEGGDVAGSQPMSTDVHRSPKKLRRSNSIINLWSRSSGTSTSRRGGEGVMLGGMGGGRS